MSRSSADEIIKGYIEEVTAYIPPLKEGIQSLRKKIDRAVIEELHRLVHTIKGASSMVGIYGLSHIAYQMEDTLDEVMAGKFGINDNVLQIMDQTVDRFNVYCSDYLTKGVHAQDLLKDTVLAFRRLRGLPADQDDTVLKPLLDIVPKIEGGIDKETASQTEGTGLLSIPEEIAIPETQEELRDEDKALTADRQDKPHDDETAVTTELPQIPPELMQSFIEESEEHLELLGRSLNILETQIVVPTVISAEQREILRQIRRSVHTLKGSSAVVGFSNVSSWAHHMEDLLDWLYETSHTITPETIRVLVDSADLLESIVARPQDPQSSKVKALREQYVDIMKESPPVAEETAETEKPEKQDDAKAAAIEEHDTTSHESTALTAEELTEESIEDLSPLRSTRTLRVGMERIDELINLGGELLIALSGFDQKMERMKSTVSELELSRDRLREIGREMEVGYEVKALEQIRSKEATRKGGLGIRHHELGIASPSVAVSDSSDFAEFDTLELDRYSQLSLIIRTLNEAVIDIGAIHNQLSNLQSELDGHLTRQRVILSELQDKMMRVRMTPMAAITNKLRRTTREVAGKLGKKIRLVVEGANIELDRLVWDKLTDPLMHLLRNASDHGIEPPALRQAIGKPVMATIKLAASREGNQVVIRVSDDGAGLNYDAIRSTVKASGLSDRADDLTEEELTSFIFLPGFSTRGKITDVSGRGIGMDVVKSNIQELKGVIQVASQKGKGTQFIIRIPLTLAAVRALLFTVGGQTYAVALNEVSEIFRVDPAAISTIPEETVRIKDQVLPLYYLTTVLGKDRRKMPSRERIAETEFPIVLIVESAGHRAGLVVDTLIGQREIVIKSTGSHLRYVKGISGATIMGDGSIVPILNITEIIQPKDTAVKTVVSAEPAVIKERPLQIMVVDDSVSIRQVVSRLMEDQGWKVQSAKDGIDALEKLRDFRPDLIVLDIEMPRMNGYEFLSAVRTQPAYAGIPVVMLTSRTAAKHRQKAISLGVKGFIVKPYNDDDFVNLVLKLTESRG